MGLQAPACVAADIPAELQQEIEDENAEFLELKRMHDIGRGIIELRVHTADNRKVSLHVLDSTVQIATLLWPENV